MQKPPAQPASSVGCDEAHGDIEFTDPAGAWLDDAQGGVSFDAAGSDSGRLPESDGMAEDPPDAETAEQAAVPAAPGRDENPFPLAGIGGHLDELRRRLVVCLGVFVPLFALGLYIYRTLWDIIIMPLERAAPSLSRFQALGPSDGLVMAMRIAFAFAVFLCLPVWTGQAWNFIAPGLTPRERRWVYLAMGSGAVLFLVGASLSYCVAIPYALEYLLPFNQSLTGWENAFTGSGYVDFIITCCAGFGLAFELPLVMLTLGWFNILTPDSLRGWWRAVVLFIFVLAAIMTPPDPFTQMLLAIPLLLLFLIGYWLVKWTHRPERDG